MNNDFLNVFIILGALQIVAFALLRKKKEAELESEAGQVQPTQKLRTARRGLKPAQNTANDASGGPVAIFPGLPRTQDELRHALRHARGVNRQRIMDRLQEIEAEDPCHDVSFLDGFATDNEILEDLR